MTHGLNFLPQADLILVMVDGEITEMGSYSELLSRENAFADFVKAFAVSECKESAPSRGKIKKSVHKLLKLSSQIQNINSLRFRKQEICLSSQYYRLPY